MNRLLQTLLIRQRIWLLVGLCLIGLALLATLAVNKAKQQYFDLKQEEYIKLTNTALRTLEFYYKEVEAGRLDYVEGRKMAKRAIDAMALGPRNYFYMYNREHDLIISHPYVELEYADDTPEEIAFSTDLDAKYRAGIGERMGYDGPTYTSLYVINKLYPDTYTGFFEYYYFLEPGRDHPVLREISETNLPDVAERKMAYSAYFEPWDWIVLTGIYQEDVNAAFYNWLWSMMAFAGAIMAVIFVVSYAISNSITKPLYQIVSGMKDISQGSGDLTNHLIVAGKHELAQLANAYNTFVDKIAETIKQVVSTNEDVEQHSETLKGKVSNTVNRSDAQLKETEMLASAANELSYSVKSVAERAQESSDAASKTEQATALANDSMTKNIQAITQLSRALEQTHGDVELMEEHSNKVASVLEVIRGIAEQTNLLALNAAIEAARAGEQGRGFAVVADEVRSLAQRTQTSTTEIQQIIENLLQGTGKVVKAVDDGLENSRTCVETATQANDSLKEVVSFATTINQMSDEIAVAVDEQSQVTQEIAQSTQNISDSSRMNLEDAETQQHEIEKMAEEILAMSKLVHQFKV